ncbi:MAG: glycosyltransferase [Bacteroidia bacterium]|nr:glycosyltransferase [Bacteroidia bacterium]
MKYAIITPAKNEESFIREMIESVARQTILPDRMIVVDDGSDDGTASIVQGLIKAYSWLELISLDTQSEKRSGGVKVVRGFNAGLKTINLTYYEFIVKLDADLSLPNDYFESVIDEFKKDGKVGMCGGIIVNRVNDENLIERDSDFHIRGAFKAIRTACYLSIGGFKEVWNWDSLDEMEAMYYGWSTKVIEKYVIHFRVTSSAYDFKEHCLKSGRDAYQMRSGLFLLTKRTIGHIFKRPYLVGGYYYILGYIIGILRKDPRIISYEMSKFISRFHIRRFLLFKWF